MILNFIKQNKGILFFLLLSLVLRLIFLDRVPTGITNDELHFVLNAKAIAMTGHDVSGLWSPWNLTTIPTEFPTSELSFVTIAFLIKFLPLSLFTARLPYVLLSLGTIFLVYLITKKLIGRQPALFVGFVFAINPWSIYVSRTSFDFPVALFYFILAFYLLLVCKKWFILLSFPALFFAFYSYIATKIIFIPYVFLVSIYSWYFINKRKFTVQYLILFALSCCLFLFFLFSSFHQVSRRTNQLFLPNSSQITQEVNDERRLSLQTPFTNIFSNKPFIYVKEFLDKYVTSFSTEILYVDGGGYEPHLAFEYSGFFYLVDFIFFFIGLYGLIRRKLPVSLVFLGIILLSQIPSILLINPTPSMIAHSILFFPFFMIFIGYGIYEVFVFGKNNTYKILLLISLTCIYSIGLSYFFFSYLFRYPIYNSESFNFSSRLLVSYLTREQIKTNNSIIVVIPKNIDLTGFFRNYIFYDNLYNQSTVKEVQKITQQQRFIMGNISFVPYDRSLTFEKDATIILTNDIPSKLQGALGKPLIIPQLKDSGSQFFIYNGKTCSTMVHNHYTQDITFNDLNVEKLTDTEFCKKFIIQY